MKVLLIKQKDISLKKYTEKLDAYGIEWEELVMNVDSLGIRDEATRAAICAEVYAQYSWKINAVQVFTKEWVNPPGRSIRGICFNKFYSSYLISYTRIRRGWEKTAIHELFHKFDNWVFVYTGVILADVVGVDDWDEGVVHGEAPGFVEYKYEKTWKIVKSHVLKALSYRRNQEMLGFLQRKLTSLRSAIRQSLAPVILEDMQHPVPGFPVTYKYGIPDENYKSTGHHLGTDFGCPINTPVLAPEAGEVAVAGFSRSLGNYCHFKYIHAGEEYTARFLHLKTIPTRGRYKKGAIIARTGNTGFSFGPHVHIDVWKDEVRLDLINRSNWNQLTVNPETHFEG